MSTIKGFLLLIFGLFCPFFLSAQTFEIRAFNDGFDNTVDVQMRCTSEPCPTTSDGLADLVFGLKWTSSDGIDLGTSINTYQLNKSDVEVPNGNDEFQAFGMTDIQDFPSDWVLNDWKTLATFAVTSMDAPVGVVEICTPAFHSSSDPNIHIVVADTGMDFTPIINGSASIDEAHVDNDGDQVSNAEDCDPNDPNDGILMINDDPLVTGIYTATNKIESAAILETNADVTFKATLSIKMMPGFKVSTGNEFAAVIEDICNPPSPPMMVAINAVNVSCAGEWDGSATTTTSNGDGNYSYFWSNGSNTANLTELTTGTYAVTVTDGTGQTATAAVTIIEDPTDTDNDLITDGCDCDPNDSADGLTMIVDNPLYDSVYTAPNKLTSTSIAEVDSVVIFKATRNIQLLPGFKVKEGSYFLAVIEDVCVPPAPAVWSEESWTAFENTEPETIVLQSWEEAQTPQHYIVFAPNPTTGYFQIQSEEQVENFKVYDLLGEKLMEGYGKDVEVSDLASGTYVVRVLCGKNVFVGVVHKQ